MSISSERVKKWRADSKQRMIDAMGGKCQCCGYNKCNDALAFHHIDPNLKDISLGSIRANPTGWTKVVEELRKCILVCHNCHSEIHSGVREIPKEYSLFDEKYSSYRTIGKYDSCPVCSKEKHLNRRYCSASCANKSKNKVDWDSLDLLDLMSKYSISELEDRLGVSNNAIYKRRDKILREKNIIAK